MVKKSPPQKNTSYFFINIETIEHLFYDCTFVCEIVKYLINILVNHGLLDEDHIKGQFA